MDPETISMLMGGAQDLKPTFQSSADSRADSQSGSIHDVLTNFGDQIVNGSKGSIWNFLLVATGAVVLTLIVLKPRKIKQ